MKRMVRALVGVLLVAQAVAAARVIARLLRTATGDRIAVAPERLVDEDAVSVIVPVLNEEHRLGPCLEGLCLQGDTVREILVVDGGSTDGTREVVQEWARRDARIRFIDASPVPDPWNGKPWGLHVGSREVDDASRWLLTIDADVRPRDQLVSSLLAHAERFGLRAMSVATPQRVSGAAEAPVHTSLLASMVYRYGIPGQVFQHADDVQANGQCFLIDRDTLCAIGGFEAVRNDLVEDVTLARRCVRRGATYGFFETEDVGALVTVEMYAGWYDALSNWSRSLPMRDRDSGPAWALRMVEMILTLGLPVPLWLLAWWLHRMPFRTVVMRLNAGMVMMRLGTQAGMVRAYISLPVTHWLAVALDPIIAAVLLWQSRRREHQWRGRTVRW